MIVKGAVGLIPLRLFVVFEGMSFGLQRHRNVLDRAIGCWPLAVGYLYSKLHADGLAVVLDHLALWVVQIQRLRLVLRHDDDVEAAVL